MIVASIAIAIVIVTMSELHTLELGQEIESMGYNLDDVDAFLDIMKEYRSDFLRSEGLRRSYEKFRRGELGISYKT